MELSAYIRKHALNIPGKLQLVIAAFAKALEIIPRQICDNAGLDSTDILNKLRMKHARGEKWIGVDVDGASGVRDNMDAFVWEPSLIKVNAISSATEAACLILSVDETVRNPQSEQASPITFIVVAKPLMFYRLILVLKPLLEQPKGHLGEEVAVWLGDEIEHVFHSMYAKSGNLSRFWPCFFLIQIANKSRSH